MKKRVVQGVPAPLCSLHSNLDAVDNVTLTDVIGETTGAKVIRASGFRVDRRSILQDLGGTAFNIRNRGVSLRLRFALLRTLPSEMRVNDTDRRPSMHCRSASCAEDDA